MTVLQRKRTAAAAEQAGEGETAGREKRRRKKTDCCYFVEQRTSLPCVCKNLVGEGVEKRLSMNKLARVAALCGVPLKPGTKCGSYKVPARL
ncbi:unnamed protein product [Spirodela intermedia]|uniref:Bifunctional inhibitor/plant lipid transfer protein/seed storage helical domain-containing protein n=1 Tax=Spirodela intermedia TaxID=51605 RepID=A0A7I8I9M9_SPIIN|nr:unnamed protein product [Spirodela intermedia]CAA6654123.1 unnamed protein product [Spirodela intermedia]